MAITVLVASGRSSGASCKNFSMAAAVIVNGGGGIFFFYFLEKFMEIAFAIDTGDPPLPPTRIRC